MPTDLDRAQDVILDAITGPGGPFAIERDEAGRAIVPGLPPTLPGMFALLCEQHGDKPGVVSEVETLSFADLDRISTRLAQGMAARGVRPGDRVAIAMRNAPAWILLYMAALKAGGVATLLNGWWEARELAHAIELTEPKMILADALRAARIAAATEHWDDHGAEMLVVDLDLPAAEALEDLLTSGPAPLPVVEPEHDATILFTSGSTGDAKGAVSTHRAVTSGLYTYAITIVSMFEVKVRSGDPPKHPPAILVAVPLFHVTGEVPVLLNSFVLGRKMVLMRKWDAGEALRLIERHQITYFVGVPTMGLELMNHPDREARDLSTLADLASGGAPRPVAHVPRLQEAFPAAQPAQGYGLTETNGVGCGNSWSNYAAKPASVGRPMRPMVELRIADEADRPLPKGEAGEIQIRSAANIRGYFRNAEATAAAFTADGWLRTGDVGYLDEDDYLFIVDRLKEIIIRGGENISMAEVEAAIYAHPAVAEAVAFGVPNDRLGEVPGALVVVREEAALDEAELRAFLEGRLAKFKLPAVIGFAGESLPRLGTGKLDRKGVKEAFLRERARAEVSAY